MSLPMPYKHFKWLDLSPHEDFDVCKIEDDARMGYILEVKLDYPNEWHDLHDLYPLAPEKVKIVKKDLSPYAKEVQRVFQMKHMHVAELMATL